MSRRRVQHLVKRNGTYQIRLPIPLKLQDAFDRKELRWSARTHDSRVASQRALEATLAFRRFCDKMIAMKDLSSDDAKTLARKFYDELVAGFRLKRTQDPDQAAYENGLQGVLVEDAVKEFNEQLETRCFSDETKILAAKRLGIASSDLAGIDDQILDRLYEAVVRARREFAHYALFRRTNTLSDYEPEDPLFAAIPSVAAVQSSAATPEGLTISETLELYVQAMSGVQWTAKTAEEKRRTFEIVRGLWGGQTPVTALTADNVRAVRDFIGSMKPHAKLDRNKLHLSRAPKDGRRLNHKTAVKYFGDVKAFLNWLEAEGYIETVPGRKVVLPKPKASAETDVRPWTQSELNTIFSSPLYAGSKNFTSRHLPGDKRRKDGFFWLLLLSLYTGARVGELLQLRIKDVHLSAETPFLEISADGKLKTAGSARRVPIHKDLLSFGLKDFVNKQISGPSQRLLRDLKLGDETRMTGAISKKVNNYLRRIKVKAGRETVLHSFRHNFIDGLRNAQVPEATQKRLLGHKDTSVTSGYGAGESLDVLKSYVDKINFGLTAETRSIVSAP